MSGDHLILDRDVPAERARLNLGTNPIDNAEVQEFTLEAELERLSNLMKENKDYRNEKNDIRKRMKQAEEDKDKMSERGKVAYEYLRSRKDNWV
jgi:hypothetical protein